MAEVNGVRMSLATCSDCGKQWREVEALNVRVCSDCQERWDEGEAEEEES